MLELLRLADLSPDWDWSRCAVIAREWKYLVPVRAFCETQGIAVQMGNEEFSGFWHLRETRAFIAWLHCREAGTITTDSLRDWAAAGTINPWNELLHQAIEEHSLETGGAETPVDHFIEWLAEWGREIRRHQRGLLLLTAHRAKGLEFDHVVVLDGGWNRVRQGEDPDEARRLYYVAMTRARETLALVRFEETHRLQEALLGKPCVLYRAETLESHFVGLNLATEELKFHIVALSLNDVDLGFAGRQRSSHPIHDAIAVLRPGDPLHTRITANNRWELSNQDGLVVGRLASRFDPPVNTRCRVAKVLAVVRWRREASKPEYRNSLQCDAWEVIVPELTFEPDSRLAS